VKLHPEAYTLHPKQREFISCSDYEVLFGGAAGGGKSYAMMIDALGLNQKWGPAITHPRYRALILRPTFAELHAFIDSSRALYKAVSPDAEYYEGVSEWRFPSGAKIKFGYLQDDSDKYKYKSEEFQWIGFEELTQFPSSSGYLYLFSRLRGVPELSKFMRATTNPDGPGHDWVKRHFNIPDDGGATRFSYTVGDETRWRRFIPARVQDNLSIDASYVNTLHMLSEQERRALLEGRWDIVDIKGAIFRPQFESAIQQNRIGAIPIETRYPVTTAWDLGAGDGCGIWFIQQVGLQHRIIDYYEAENLPLDHFVTVIRAKGYNYESHLLPHDAIQRKQGATSNANALEMLADLGLRNCVVTPRPESKRTSIEMARQIFAGCWFDKLRCEKGLSALSSYQFKFDPKTGSYSHQPLHNWASRASDAFQTYAIGYDRAQLSGWGDVLPKGAIYRKEMAAERLQSLFQAPRDLL